MEVKSVEITSDSRVFFAEKKGEWDERDPAKISRTIFSNQFSIDPREGDIYWRSNTSNGSIYCSVFTGERNKFYDHNFGAGEEYHGRIFVDCNDMAKAISKVCHKSDNHKLEDRINNHRMKLNLYKIFIKS